MQMKVKKADNQPRATYTYHEPPPGVANYSDNPSVFGKILNGELPSMTYLESKDILAFRAPSPKTKLHALVIPKRYIKSVYSLTPNDVNLVQDMRRMGLELLETQQPKAFVNGDYILCFHIPPFVSVDHLHLFVLAPVSEMSVLYHYGKYSCCLRWCVSDVEVIESLRAGQAAVPYHMHIIGSCYSCRKVMCSR